MFTRMNYLWELCTGLYMMDTSEKLIFSAFTGLTGAQAAAGSAAHTARGPQVGLVVRANCFCVPVVRNNTSRARPPHTLPSTFLADGVVVGTLSLVVYYVARVFTGTPAAIAS
jgi:hypothetical protein